MTIFAATLRAELVRGAIFEFSVAMPENKLPISSKWKLLPGS
jgi:hypothetical protein